MDLAGPARIGPVALGLDVQTHGAGPGVAVGQFAHEFSREPMPRPGPIRLEFQAEPMPVHLQFRRLDAQADGRIRLAAGLEFHLNITRSPLTMRQLGRVTTYRQRLALQTQAAVPPCHAARKVQPGQSRRG